LKTSCQSHRSDKIVGACIRGAKWVFKRELFIWIYRLIFAPFALLLSPKYLLKMKRRGDYEGALSMRFGIGIEDWPKQEGRYRVWVQAVSLGEILVIEALLRKLASDDRIEIFLTTTTSTGYGLAKERYSDICDRIVYFPLDFWPFSRRVWKRVQPDLAICAETELWPEHMQQALNSNTPMVLVNGRLSDNSFKYARPLAFMFRGHLRRSINRVLAISEHDAQRFEAIGVERSKMVITGNLKLDVSIGDRLSQNERAEVKARLGLGEGFVLLGSSTWPGEETALLESFKRLREKLPDCRLMLVPRHAERREEVRTLLESSASGFKWHFKSEGDPNRDVDILVGDTSGELRLLTQLADLAFIGKSLPPHKEGQTPIECGLLGVPMVFGPGMNNFRSIREGLLESGSAEELSDVEALQSRLVALALDEEARETQKRNQEVWAKNSRGALARTVEEIDKLLHR
jgi:3-deoxy-D-manno-octulosonic-acid transferase